MAKTSKAHASRRRKLELTQTMRDYLKTAYRLTVQGETLTITLLADAQKVAPASATAMVKKLTKLRLMKHDHYGAIDLNAEGRRQALLAIRRHRLIECFLVRVLNYNLFDCHEDSDRLEPVISDKFEKKIDEVLGHPKRCPHGDPIPTPAGEIDVDSGFPLAELEKEKPATVLRVPGSKSDLLHYLIDLGIVPETPVRLVKREPFGGPLHLKLSDRMVMLGPEAAEQVYVVYA